MRCISSIAGSTRSARRAHNDDTVLRRGRSRRRTASAMRVALSRAPLRAAPRARAPASARAAREPHRRQDAPAGPTQRRVEQAPVGGGDRPVIEPAAGQLDRLRQPSGLERSLRCRQAERSDVPADHLGTRRELEAHSIACQAAAVGDRFEGQPLEPAAAPATTSRDWEASRPCCGRSASHPASSRARARLCRARSRSRARRRRPSRRADGRGRCGRRPPQDESERRTRSGPS